MIDETDGKAIEATAKGVSRRNFIKGVISSGVAVSSANYPEPRPLRFRASGRRSWRSARSSKRQRPAAARRRHEAGNAGHDTALQARAHRHQAAAATVPSAAPARC